MALMECPECGGKVSDKVASCPHRGRPIGHREADGAVKAKEREIDAVKAEILDLKNQ